MIEWIKYDPANPPEEHIEHLVCSSGSHVWVARFISGKWHVDYSTLNYVTHYAHINLPDLPGEETEEEFTINHEPIKTIEVTAHIKNMGYQENTLKFEAGEEDRP